LYDIKHESWVKESSANQGPDSRCWWLGSILWHSTWNLLQRTWNRDGLLSEYFGCHLPIIIIHSSFIISVKVILVQQLWSRLELHLLLTVWLDTNRKYATNTSYQVTIHNQQVMLHLTLHNSSSIHTCAHTHAHTHTHTQIYNSAITSPKPGWERRRVNGWLGSCRGTYAE
jgi:hypothetical protein